MQKLSELFDPTLPYLLQESQLFYAFKSYDCRIVFSLETLETDDNEQNEVIILIDI